MRIAIKSNYEAYIYLNGQVKRLWHGDGNVRRLVLQFLLPASTLGGVAEFNKASVAASEDTQVLSADILKAV